MADATGAPDPHLLIPDHELVIKATRSGGPGGQHVNTASTRVEVRWNVRASAVPTAPQRARLLARLARRLDRDGWLRVVSARSRSQHANRADATERLRDLVAAALRVPKRRKPTTIPRAERARRLAAKRRRGERKRERGNVRPDDEPE